MSDDNKKDAAEYFAAILKKDGVAVSSVQDGHVLAFDRSYLQALLDKHSDKEQLVIFIKRPDFSSAN